MRGIWTALVTPLNENGQLDLTAFRRMLKNQQDAGVSGVIPCGTTGESPTLSLDEKKTLIEVALEELRGSSTKVIASTGTNSTQDTIELSKWASDQGAAGLLVVTPYYNKPSQSGLETHYRSIADAVSCPIVLYNVPSRTGITLTTETIIKLAKHPRIRAIKEASGNIPFTSEILDALSGQSLSMDVLSGDDVTYLPLASVGASGVISVASNLIPKVMIALLSAVEAGSFEKATKIHRNYYPLFRDLFLESNHVPIKHALAYAGWCLPYVRAPLALLSSTHREKLEQTLKLCGIQKE